MPSPSQNSSPSRASSRSRRYARRSLRAASRNTEPEGEHRGSPAPVAATPEATVSNEVAHLSHNSRERSRYGESSEADQPSPSHNPSRSRASSRRSRYARRSLSAGSWNTEPEGEHRGSPAPVAATPEAIVGNEVAHLSQSGRKRSRDGEDLEADQPSQKRARVVEETNMWTTVKRYLESPKDNLEPQVSCPICMMDIAIRGVPIQSPCPYKIINGFQAVGVVLPCAHIICQDCIGKHLSAQVEININHQTCPCCRADLRFSGCKHPIPGKRIPIATSEDYSMVPPTIPELRMADLNFPGWCLDCSERCMRAYVKVSFNYIAAEIHESVDAESVVRDPEWQRIVDASYEAVREYFHKITMTASWKIMRPCDRLLEVAIIDGDMLDAHDMISTDDRQDWIEHVEDGGERKGLWSFPVWSGI